MSFFRSETWRRLYRKGITRSEVFLGQHSRYAPRIGKLVREYVAPRRYSDEGMKAKRRRQIARDQLGPANGVAWNSQVTTSRNGNTIVSEVEA